jgi:Ca2+-binding EF-hand superfamily protein
VVLVRIHVIVGVLSVLSAGAALSQGREGPGAMFDRADGNADGVVSRDEFIAARAEQFAGRDRNGDGFIDGADLGERAAARPRISQAMNALVTQFDADKDGKVGKDEFVSGGMKLFDRADADKSGSLDAKELDAAKAGLRERASR